MINKNSIIFIVLIVFYWFGVLFYDFIDKNLGFSFLDELLTLSILLIYIQFYLSKKFIINKSFIIFIIVFLFYIGYSFFLKSNSTIAIATDTIILLKPFLVYFSIVELKPNISTGMKKSLKLNAEIGLILLPFLLLLNYHPSRYATASIVTGILYLYASRLTLKNVLFFILILSIGLLSARSKMYGFFVLASALSLYFYYNRDKKFEFSLKHLISFTVILVLLLLASYEKLYFYFYTGVFESENMFARPLLMLTGYKIALDFFPFGSGFASFASYSSGLYYSDIYYKYNLFTQHGLSQEDTSFISDIFLAEILGQFGFFGIVVFLSIIINILKETYEIQKNNLYMRKKYLLVILIILFFIIESIADSTFTQNRGVFIVLILSLVLVEMRYKYLEKKV